MPRKFSTENQLGTPASRVANTADDAGQGADGSGAGAGLVGLEASDATCLQPPILDLDSAAQSACTYLTVLITAFLHFRILAFTACTATGMRTSVSIPSAAWAPYCIAM